jgi:hypothetical protein
MFILGLALFGFGYATFYYGANVLVSAYMKTTTMNPVPFTALLGIPGAGGSAQGDAAGAGAAAAQGAGGTGTNAGGAAGAAAGQQ